MRNEDSHATLTTACSTKQAIHLDHHHLLVVLPSVLLVVAIRESLGQGSELAVPVRALRLVLKLDTSANLEK